MLQYPRQRRAWRLPIFFAVLALLIGIIGRCVPEWFLSTFSSVGFVFWALTGNNLPPYLSLEAFTEPEFSSWIKPGDVIVSGAPKAGTNWLLYACHQIRTRGEGYFNDVNVETPWPELLHRPGQRWAGPGGLKELLLSNGTRLPARAAASGVLQRQGEGKLLRPLWDGPEYPFRIFKSHSTPAPIAPSRWTRRESVLPVRTRKDVKFVVIVRAGDDVIPSFAAFIGRHRPEFSAMWGGFPRCLDLLSIRDLVFEAMLPGRPLAYIFWDFVAEWFPLRHAENVLLLHYSDLHGDLRGSLTRLAVFLGVQLSVAELDAVVDHCTFESMFALRDRFNYWLWAAGGEDGFPGQDIMCGPNHCQTEGSLLRKGAVGEGVKALSTRQQGRWNHALQEHFQSTPGLLHWVTNGGELPAPA
jgi:hypothetical protein